MKSPLCLTTSRFQSKFPLFTKARAKETTVSKQTHKPTINLIIYAKLFTKQLRLNLTVILIIDQFLLYHPLNARIFT